MAKTYIDTVKYLIKAGFEIDGIVEKPDIVGAIFGQTEGLLGDELDLRELQKNGRIGRIEVETQVRGGRSIGTILVPSSLDMVETSILAAGLEIVDRVGPCDARISVTKIEDTRNIKRKQLLERAKGLLKTLLVEEIPESKELSELVREEVKTAGVAYYGEDRLPAGPGVATSGAIIMVEGRADVINLLKNSINNVVAIGGATISKTVAELGKQKEVTVFLDGDRGGDIVLRELMTATDIDYVARAPPGKEVEELTRKEIIKCLRRRIPIEQVEGYLEVMEQKARAQKAERAEHREQERERRPAPLPAPTAPHPVPARPVITQVEERALPAQALAVEAAAAQAEAQESGKASILKNILKELEGSLKARILDKEGKVLREVPIREIMRVLSEMPEAHALVLDGIVTQRLVDLAEEKKIEFIAGIRASNIMRKPASIQVILAETS